MQINVYLFNVPVNAKGLILRRLIARMMVVVRKSRSLVRRYFIEYPKLFGDINYDVYTIE